MFEELQNFWLEYTKAREPQSLGSLTKRHRFISLALKSSVKFKQRQ